MQGTEKSNFYFAWENMRNLSEHVLEKTVLYGFQGDRKLPLALPASASLCQLYSPAQPPQVLARCPLLLQNDISLQQPEEDLVQAMVSRYFPICISLEEPSFFLLCSPFLI
jgi:hypothetical protein